MNDLAFILDRLKPERVSAGAASVADGLEQDGYSLLDYQPGDGTSYKLVFARCLNPSRAWLADENDSWVAVAWHGHGCYPFELGEPGFSTSADYVMEKLGGNLAGAVALLTLFTAVSKAMQ